MKALPPKPDEKETTQFRSITALDEANATVFQCQAAQLQDSNCRHPMAHGLTMFNQGLQGQTSPVDAKQLWNATQVLRIWHSKGLLLQSRPNSNTLPVAGRIARTNVCICKCICMHVLQYYYAYTHIHTYACVCVCVCASMRAHFYVYLLIDLYDYICHLFVYVSQHVDA